VNASNAREHAWASRFLAIRSRCSW